ncbi:hypothetical protein GQ464_008670 [Rhodocaloribacter litoris]|uniref:hypothetical protein n=1 Tax=Rhodocaloribacter litoris TaxID=2558931 RepID=UPI00142119AF|nr:hypothetical protein [Rhodocaloribacter litoris]QXD16990.1 hypothetical protein GQ464_008670 [Rhodocaloribacter litoris]
MILDAALAFEIFKDLHLKLACGKYDTLPTARAVLSLDLDIGTPLPFSCDGAIPEELVGPIRRTLLMAGFAGFTVRYYVKANRAVRELVWPSGQPPIEMLRPGRPSLSEEEVIKTLRAVREAIAGAGNETGMEGALTTAAEALALSRSGLESRLSEIFRRIGAYYSRRTLSEDLLREVERCFSQKSG